MWRMKTHTRLERMEALLTECEIARGIPLPDILGLFSVVVAHGHVGVKDGEFGHRGLFCVPHGCFTDMRTWPIGANDHRPRRKCAVRESGYHAFATLIESNINQTFSVL